MIENKLHDLITRVRDGNDVSDVSKLDICYTLFVMLTQAEEADCDVSLVGLSYVDMQDTFIKMLIRSGYEEVKGRWAIQIGEFKNTQHDGLFVYTKNGYKFIEFEESPSEFGKYTVNLTTDEVKQKVYAGGS